MKTRDRILDKSRDLFNEQGTRNVSTNHVAKALTMSPGNLYFHFHNKEEIVRELFLRMTRETRELLLTDHSPESLTRKHLELAWKYRFLHREMYDLRRRDQELTRVWKMHLMMLKKRLHVLLRRWSEENLSISNSVNSEAFFEVFLMVSSGSMQVFENESKRARADVLDRAQKLLLNMLTAH